MSLFMKANHCFRLVSRIRRFAAIRLRRNRHVYLSFAGMAACFLWIISDLWSEQTDRQVVEAEINVSYRYLRLATQQDIDVIGKYLNVHLHVDYHAISNETLDDEDFFLMWVTLTNTGPVPIPASTWELYGYMIRLSDMQNFKNGFYLEGCGLRVFHVTGYTVMFEPVFGVYTELKPNESCVFHLTLDGRQESRSESFPNWYVSSGNTDITPRLIETTRGEYQSFVGGFDYEDDWEKRTMYLKPLPLRPVDRYTLYRGSVDMALGKVQVLPTPMFVQKLSLKKVEFDTKTWFINKSLDFPQERDRLAAILTMEVLPTKNIGSCTCIDISKQTDEFDVTSRKQRNPEAYSLRISDKGIYIKAQTNQGAFYAIQTLLSLMSQSGDLSSSRLPMVVIRDAPRFPYRGLLLDVARNFFKMEEIMKLMDVMAMYKMNKLHLHLSDDEGWRLQIPGLPQLTEVGSKRCHDLEENRCLMSNMGSGPYLNSSGNGFYSVEDYRDILRHAVSLHITVIPEFDMPGHSRAAIKSIRAASQFSKDPAVFSLADERDQSEHFSVQGYRDNIINPCLSSTYVFSEKVISEVRSMHADIQPLEVYHVGGEEVPDTAWSESPACKAFLRQHPGLKTKEDLVVYFLSTVAKQCADHNISVGVWENGVMVTPGNEDVKIPAERNTFKSRDVAVYLWVPPSWAPYPHRSRLLANTGYKVILAYCELFYFDHWYENDPEERGMRWASDSMTTRHVWEFTMETMWADRYRKCPKSVKDKTDCTTLKQGDNILGIQANLFTEMVRNTEQLEYMLFPRLLALAERAWHAPTWKWSDRHQTDTETEIELDWLEFVNHVGKQELRRLDAHGIRYRLSPPGAIISDGVLKARTEFPGLVTEYYSQERSEWIAFTEVAVTEATRIRTRSADGKRHSRIVNVRLPTP